MDINNTRPVKFHISLQFGDNYKVYYMGLPAIQIEQPITNLI
jgi:hypothetical protein